MPIHQKVSAGIAAGFLSTIIITELNRRGITIDGNEASAITGLLVSLAGYITPAADDGTNNNDEPPNPNPNPNPAPPAGA